MSYAHLKTYELRYSDFDFRDELKLSSLLEILQESACMSADELGFGYDVLRPCGFGFIIVNTYCELARPVRLGERLTVETWPLPPRHVIFERHYRVTAGDEVARIATRWCLVDLKNFSLLTPDRLGEVHERCPYRNERVIETVPRKIARIGSGREVRRMTVCNSDCDHYLHANNAKYADLFLDCFTMAELGELEISAFNISYAKQIKEGETIVFLREDGEDSSTLEALDGTGTLCTQMRFWYKRRQR